MVQDKTPLFVETDEAGNVTNFAEFVSGTDVVSQELGGTGATSVSGVVIGLRSSILIDELASGVSGTAQQATGLIFNPTTGNITPEPGVTDFNITGKTLTVSSISLRRVSSGKFTITDVGVSATDLSAETFTGDSVSATDISGLTIISPGGDGNNFYLKREVGATYPNLLKAENGILTIQSQNNIRLRTGGGETMAKFEVNGANELYYDNTKKLETRPAGVLVDGGFGATTSISSVTVSATGNISASSFNGVPYPAPFAYAKLSDDGTAAASETNIGAGATVVEIESNSGDIIWDGSNDYFTVVKAGTYELTARVVIEVASTTVVTLKIKTGSTVHNTYSPKINGAVDPQEATIHAVFTAAADDDISCTHQDDGAVNVNAGAGTTMILKRLL